MKSLKFIDNKKFVKKALNGSFETFIVNIAVLKAFLRSSKMIIHFLQETQLFDDNLV